MRTRHHLSILALTLATACAPAGQVAAPTAAPQQPPAALTQADAAAALITAAGLYERIAFLASDELRGRDTPSPGLETAAEYIAAQFEAAGLQPAGDGGTFIQRWALRTRAAATTGAQFRLEAAGNRHSIQYGADFFALSDGGANVQGMPVFAGEATPTPRQVTLEPGSIPVFFLPGAELNPQWEARVGAAISSAVGAGAQAVVLVLDPGISAEVVQMVASQVGPMRVPVPIFATRYDAARQILAAAGSDLDVLRAAGTVAPIADATLRLGTPAANEVRPPNVVALLPGSDPALHGTYVVYSAHFDHVGVGAPDATGDSIYNGADDNASGTAALMEIARAFAALPEAPRRSILFVAVSGEERGLLGSQAFVANPTVPLDSMIANINMDMIGRNHPDTVVAVGIDYTTLGPVALSVAEGRPDLGLTISPDPWPEERLFFRSDHFSWAHRGVPAIFFTTGLHADYHRPSDTADKIDTDKLARISRLLFHFGKQVANAPGRPQWTDKGEREVGGLGGWTR